MLWVPDDEHEYGLRYRPGCAELRFCGLDQPIVKDGVGYVTYGEFSVMLAQYELFYSSLLKVSWL